MLSAEHEIDSQIRKFEHSRINGVNIKLQLVGTGSDTKVINTDTLKKIGKLMLIKTAKTVRSVMGNKRRFPGKMWNYVIFRGKTCQVNIFLIKIQEINLVPTSWSYSTYGISQGAGTIIN